MSKSIICYEDGYTPTTKEREEDEAQLEMYINFVRKEKELKELRKSFRLGKTYTTQQIRQVIDSRIEWHKNIAQTPVEENK